MLNNKKGTAIVEFAIIFPITMLLFFGIVEFGLMLFDKAVITNASREGARAGIVSRPPGEQLTEPKIKGVVKNYCNNYLMVKRTINDEDIDVTWRTDPITNWVELVVVVRYQYEFIGLPGFMTGPFGPIILRAWTIMKMENNEMPT